MKSRLCGRNGIIGLFAAIIGGLCLATPSISQAAIFGWDVKVANAPAGANDIHLIFTGTGGSVANRTAVFPAAQNFAGSPLNGIDASFAALAAGDTYEATFTTTFSPVQFNSGYWTKDGNQFGTIGGGDVTLQQYTTPVPEPETYAMLLAGLGLFGLAAQRRKQKAA